MKANDDGVTMFGKKQQSGELCSACDRRVADGQKVCACGTATRFMTFDERREYEVEQWRRSRQPASA